MSCISFDSSYKYTFSEEMIIQTRDLNKLLTIEIELSHICNYSCKYCYSSAGKEMERELSLEEIYEVIDQAENLGVKNIVIIGGGEPLLYPHIKEVITYIFSRQISMILFTNGACMNEELALFLYCHNVFPVLKLNGIHPKTINWLCGNPNAYKYFVKALTHLRAAGYAQGDEKMGISTIICRQNSNEIVPLWQWVRENNLIPYFERVSPQGRANSHDLQLPLEELRDVFERLAEVDIKNFNIQWESNHPPIAGSTCNRHFYSLYVKSNGDIIPCAGIDFAVGNIRDKSLQDIITGSKVIQELRHIDRNIKGRCRNCECRTSCYGCRGNAFQVDNDYLAEDPFCWKKQEI